MVIAGKWAEGYLINCDRREHCNSFLVETLEVETRCPSCGQRESSVDLSRSYVFLQRASRIARIARARAARVALHADVANDRGLLSGNADLVA